jgi:adenylate kinase family enzyme
MTDRSPGTVPYRTAVVGTSGSGKTTLAHELARRLDIPHIELDALYWQPNWTPTPEDVFRERVGQALAGETWTVDGNYSRLRDIIWRRADTVVWLNYPLPVVLWRVTMRTLRRSLTGEVLWDTNRERLGEAFFGRESIIWYSFKTYGRRKREYPALFARPENAHLHVVRLHSPGEARRWLESLPRDGISRKKEG